ncbi:MAG: sigma-70 family RNA polymerase sigma factor [Chlorobium sp.]|nr:sigma-70 family RNA polymerase sigma factor [Chlorobium sp.]
MQIVPLKTFFSKVPPQPPNEATDYARLIVEHLPYIEKQCRRAAESPSSHHSDAEVDNEADHLLTEVIDHLKADNFKVLRDFRGDAKITTYLTSIISNLVVDVIRSRRGRSRAGERAKDLGPVAEQLHKLVYGLGYTLADSYGHLVASHGISESEDELRGMLQKIRGKDGITHTTTANWPHQGREVLVDNEVEVVVPDPAKGADELLIDDQRNQKRGMVIGALMEGLSGEERFMVRLRFPASESESSKSIREIATLVGQTEKSVDNRLRRILMRCRETLLGRGLSLDDLICVGE